METKHNPSEVDWARLAAYIDGEGSVLLNRFGTNNTAAMRKRMWIRVVVANNDFRLMIWLCQTFGGTVATQHNVHLRNPKHAQPFKWHVSCKMAEAVLRGCLPWFIIKKEQAEIALAFQASLGGPGKFVSKEVRAYRETLRERLHSLKRITPMYDSTPEQLVAEMKRGPKTKIQACEAVKSQDSLTNGSVQ